MEKSVEYLGLLITFGLSLGIACLMLGLNALLGPKNKSSAVKSEPFECGVEPLSKAAGQFSIRFYLMAMLFILFDVELVFLFPWAVLFREMGVFGLIEMAFFMGFVVLGFCYVWRKGALEWE